MQGTAAAPDGAGRSEHGLKANAINYVSSVVIGVASTAPGYSLAAVLGFIIAIEGVGVQAPGGDDRLVHPDRSASRGPTAI